jgi:hypothetical protein
VLTAIDTTGTCNWVTPILPGFPVVFGGTVTAIGQYLSSDGVANSATTGNINNVGYRFIAPVACRIARVTFDQTNWTNTTRYNFTRLSAAGAILGSVSFAPTSARGQVDPNVPSNLNLAIGDSLVVNHSGGTITGQTQLQFYLALL